MNIENNLIPLYEVPRNSRIKIKGLLVNDVLTEELNFKNVDGMYSVSYDDDGNMIKLPSTYNVEVIK